MTHIINRHPKDKRKYIRLDTVFPVEFRLVSPNGQICLTDWLQGFTRNICEGGICLEINKINPEFVKFLEARQAKLALKIEVPVIKNPIIATANTIWINTEAENLQKHIMGICYEEIDPKHNKTLLYYAWMKKLFVPVIVLLMVLLSIGFIGSSFINANLMKKNKAVVEQLMKVIQESGIAKNKIDEFTQEKNNLQAHIDDLQAQVSIINGEKEDLNQKNRIKDAENYARVQKLNSEIEKINKEKIGLESKLMSIQSREREAAINLSNLNIKKINLEKVNMEKLHQWLVTHQNHRSGLVMSFEGDNEISGWAFTYDQSLASQEFLLDGDLERARKVLDFYLTDAKKGSLSLFYNAYYVNDGSVAEYTIHAGPNIWLGLAAAQFYARTKESAYLSLAQEIAEGIINLQAQDKEGGIRGGPDVSWFATEHNLDAYAFFNILYQVTKQNKYSLARDKILDWLVKHTYDKAEVPVKRGKGDSTIATDTYAWSIAAIGPEKLKLLNMDPDEIMKFAQENCAAEVDFLKPDGTVVRIKGFDFAPQKHVARGGVVTPEWTSQMIISLRMMADYYSKKNMIIQAGAYAFKADMYLSNLAKMIITSPSPSGQGGNCLPYASLENVDTGHGWMTPKGRSTGSVAGTAYTIFAYYNYNPLQLKE